VNTAYKHLDSKLRIAELTVGQWLAVLAGLGAAIAWGYYLSPFGSSLTLMSAVYIGAIPATVALFAGVLGFDPVLVARSAIRWSRLDGRFAPGSGESASGYVVTDDAGEEARREARERNAEVDLSVLWERQR
jgi:hypothetical protein